MPKLSLAPVPRPVKIIAFFIATLLALLAIVGVGVTYAYKDSYYPGIKVNGIAVGGVKKAEADAKVIEYAKAVSEKKVSIALPDIAQPVNESTGLYPENIIETKGTDIGLAVAPEAALDQAWATGHAKGAVDWLKQVTHLLLVGGQSFTTVPTVDQEKVRGFIATSVVEKASPPAPAKVVVEGKNVTIVDQVPGLAVDGTSLTNQLADALAASTDSDVLSLRIPPVLEDATIGRTTVQPIADQLSKLGDTKVSFTADGVKLSPSREELLQWYTPVLSEEGQVSLGVNAERIGSYLQKNGSRLDQKKSLASMTKAATDWLKEPKNSTEVAVTLKPSQVVTVGSYEAGLYEGKYFFVNLSEQKVYRMNGQTMEKVYRVSTGKWSTPTPRGSFQIKNKIQRAFSSSYGLYMPWWMNFVGTTNSGEQLPIGDYGFHELPEWPNGYKEGQGHLGTAVSHGCVRFGIGDAKEVYDWAEIGTPVVIQ